MKFPGKLIIHRQDVIDALQKWLDERWTVNPPVITDIEAIDLQRSSSPYTFNTVQLQLESNKSFVTGKP